MAFAGAAHSGQVAIPWMMNQGMTLFGDIWEQHAPGSSLLAAAAQMFIDIDPGLLGQIAQHRACAGAYRAGVSTGEAADRR